MQLLTVIRAHPALPCGRAHAIASLRRLLSRARMSRSLVLATIQPPRWLSRLLRFRTPNVMRRRSAVVEISHRAQYQRKCPVG
ncbi:unnamed protein product [Acidocella sp. C78]|nr:unnamed protein product [Acidocella sp. C78]